MSFERLRDHFVVGEVVLGRADDLIVLVALAGDQQHIARLERSSPRDGSPRGGRRSPSAPGAAAMISARIVAASSVRGLSSVTITRSASARRDLAHHRALALVAIAAAAEDDDELAARIGPQRCERGLRAHRLVRIVDEDRRAVVLAHELEPALGARAASRAPRAPSFGSTPVAIARPSATSALLTWNAPVSGRWKLIGSPTWRPVTRWPKPSLAMSAISKHAPFAPDGHQRRRRASSAANMKASCRDRRY